jgi:hypothetical protein
MRIVLSLVHGMGGALRTADGADGATFIVEAPLHQYRGDGEGAEARPPAT